VADAGKPRYNHKMQNLINSINTLFTSDVWWSYLLRLALLFFLTWLVYRLSWHLADRLLRVGKLSKRGRQLRQERYQTLRRLIASMITIVAGITAVIIALSQFTDSATLI
jgi:hypothetical protein